MKGFVHCCFSGYELVKVLAHVPSVEMTGTSSAGIPVRFNEDCLFSCRYERLHSLRSDCPEMSVPSRKDCASFGSPDTFGRGDTCRGRSLFQVRRRGIIQWSKLCAPPRMRFFTKLVHTNRITRAS